MKLENYHLYRFGIWLVGHLPVSLAYIVGGLVADLNFLFTRKSRRAVYDNLGHALPPGTSSWRRWRAARGAFRYFAFSLVDFFRVPHMTAQNAGRFVPEVVGWENVEAVLASGKGAIFATLHMGSWEMAGAYLSVRGVPLTVAALPHKDTRIDHIFVGNRISAGMEVVPVSGAMRRLRDALTRGRFIALVIDRDTTGYGITVPFFGAPARLPHGHALLALSLGVPILPGFIHRRPDMECVLEIGAPIYPDRARDTPESLTSATLRVLEDFIRRYPRQWSAFTRIWEEKAQPAQLS